MDETEHLLKQLCEARGICGHEGEVREIMKERLARLGEISFDGLGSVICEKRGARDRPRVMVSAHMDEIGFMVMHISSDGFLRVIPIGSWRPSILPGSRVVVQGGKGQVPGAFGGAPPHSLPPGQQDAPVTLRDLYVDVGASSKEEVDAAGIRIGSPVTPEAEFTVMDVPGTYMAKALDDRGACALMVEGLETLQETDHPNTMVGVATAQEEPSEERGAATSVQLVNPDVAIALECGGADDVPDVGCEEPSVRIGGGPVYAAADKGMLVHLKLRDLLIEAARAVDVPIQVSVSERGQTDGTRIHLHGGGVPCIVLAIPARHIHTYSAIMKRSDYDQTLAIFVELLRRLDEETVADLKAW